VGSLCQCRARGQALRLPGRAALAVGASSSGEVRTLNSTTVSPTIILTLQYKISKLVIWYGFRCFNVKQPEYIRVGFPAGRERAAGPRPGALSEAQAGPPGWVRLSHRAQAQAVGAPAPAGTHNALGFEPLVALSLGPLVHGGHTGPQGYTGRGLSYRLPQHVVHPPPCALFCNRS